FVRSQRGRPAPLVELSLFRNRAFSAGLLVIAAFFASMVGLMLVLSLFTQLGLGFTPLHAGLTFAPWALGTAIGAALSGAVFAPRFGRRVIHSGLMIVVLGLAAIWLVVRAAGPAVTTWQLAPTLLACGIGGGLTLAPLFDVILAGVREDEVGSGSG